MVGVAISKWLSSFCVWRVSSQAMRSARLSTSRARRVMSSRLPGGVETRWRPGAKGAAGSAIGFNSKLEQLGSFASLKSSSLITTVKQQPQVPTTGGRLSTPSLRSVAQDDNIIFELILAFTGCGHGQSLLFVFLALDSALLREEGHGAHEVLHADDAYYTATFGDGNEREAAAGGQAADGGAECVLGPGNLEGARHDRLHIAIAVAAQGVHNALPRNDADQLRAADYGEVLLQGMNAAGEGVGEGGRGRERGEVGEHHFAHVHCVYHGLEEDTLIFNLRADHDEKSSNEEPGAVEQHAGDHGGQGEQLSQAGGRTPGGRNAMLAGEAAAQKASKIKRVGGQQVEQPEAGLHPDHAAEQVCRSDPGLVKEPDVAACAHKGYGQSEGRCKVRYGASESECKQIG